MSTDMPATGDVHLVVGYDGSPPATRALDAAVRLLHGRTGNIEVVYIAHLPAVDMLSADAIAGVEDSFDEVSRDLHAQVRDQLRGRDLVCYCAPLPCHGELLLRLANASHDGRVACWRSRG